MIQVSTTRMTRLKEIEDCRLTGIIGACGRHVIVVISGILLDREGGEVLVVTRPAVVVECVES